MTDNIKNNKDDLSQISSSLLKVLNRHGYGFQYAVVKTAEELFKNQISKWILEVTEFPVETKQKVTHIDIVFSSKSRMTFLVSECKRSDPATSNWCFVKSPYTIRNSNKDEIYIERFEADMIGEFGPGIMGISQDIHQRKYPAIQRKIVKYHSQKMICHYGFEMKTNQKGDGIAVKIDDAITQVLRGTSGMINYFFKNENKWPFNPEMRPYIQFIPVIFTTANIFSTQADLSKAELNSGHIPDDEVKLERESYVWFNHNRTIDLRYDYSVDPIKDDISKEMISDITRSIAFVNCNGIEKFLSSDWEEILRL